MSPIDLNPAERALWCGFSRGAAIDLRTGDQAADEPGGGQDWGDERTVRAEIIAALLQGVHQTEPGHTPSVWLAGARIAGRLRLSFAEVHCPLILEDCHFDESPDLYWAKLGFTSLRGCVLPGLIGSNVKIDGHLRLNRCTVTGELKLLGARIAGGLLLDAAHVSNPGNMSINGERLEVAGDILLKNGFVSVDLKS